jgi:hypothetical protein
MKPQNLIPYKTCLLAIAPVGLAMSALGAPVIHKDIYSPATVVLEDFSGTTDPSNARTVATFGSISGGAATYNYAASAGNEGYITFSTLARSFDPSLYKSMRLRMAVNRSAASSNSFDVFPTLISGPNSVSLPVTSGTTLKETSFDLSTITPNGTGVRIDPFNYTNDATADSLQIDYIMADLGPTIGFEFNRDADLNQTTLSNITSSVANGVLSGTASGAGAAGTDPQLSFVGGGAPTIDAGIYKFVEIRMKGDPGDRIELFWTTAAKPIGTPAVTIESAATSDGAYHTYLLDFSADTAWTGNLASFRLDPSASLGSTFEVDYVRFMKVRGPEAPIVLFSDNFDNILSTSLTNPATRATGTLASQVKYAWSSDPAAVDADLVVDGKLNWDANGNRTVSNNQHGSNGVQNLRFGTAANSGHFDWFPHVGGKVWYVEYDILTGTGHPLNLGVSDVPINGTSAPFDNADYDFGFGNFASEGYYDTDNDAPTVGSVRATKITNTFPSRSTVYRIRVRFDELLGKATMFVNGTRVVAETTTLDFENNARYIAFGEPSDYAGYIDNLVVSVMSSTVPEPFAVIPALELIPNGNQFQLSGAVAGPTADAYNIAGTLGDYSPFWGSSAVVTGWSPYYEDPDSLANYIGTPGVDDTGVDNTPVLNNTFYLDTLMDVANDSIILNSSNNYRNGLRQNNILNGVTVRSGVNYQLKIDVARGALTDTSQATFTAALTKGASAIDPATAVTGSLISIAAASLPTAGGTFQTATISGAALLAAQTDGPVNVIFEQVNPDTIAGFPTSPNPVDLTQVSQVRIASLSLTLVSPANDLNKDGVFDSADVTLANLYLAGNGGETAEVRQANLTGQGMAAPRALAFLNLTAFDTDGNGTFNAADVTALQTRLATDENVVINSAALVGGQFVVQASDLTIGRPYRLMRGTDLTAFDVQVDSVTPTSTSATLTDPSPPAGKAFYRVAN